MARVKLSTSGLQVSLPGYNVNTATPEQMAFDSTYPGLGVRMTGSATVPAATPPSFATPESSGVIEIPYGFTLAYIPFILVQWRWSDDPTSQMRGGGQWYHYTVYDEPEMDPETLELPEGMEDSFNSYGIGIRARNSRLFLTNNHSSKSIIAKWVLFWAPETST